MTYHNDHKLLQFGRPIPSRHLIAKHIWSNTLRLFVLVQQCGRKRNIFRLVNFDLLRLWDQCECFRFTMKSRDFLLTLQKSSMSTLPLSCVQLPLERLVLHCTENASSVLEHPTNHRNANTNLLLRCATRLWARLIFFVICKLPKDENQHSPTNRNLYGGTISHLLRPLQDGTVPSTPTKIPIKRFLNLMRGWIGADFCQRVERHHNAYWYPNPYMSHLQVFPHQQQ